jgi:acetylglutamate kinase
MTRRRAEGAARRRLTILKVGGSLLESSAAGGAVLDRVAAAWEDGEEILVVHGGGDQLSRWLERLGIASRFLDGQRVTTPEMLPVALMVLGGLINRRLVEGLLARGCPAVGITGADGAGTAAVPVAAESLGAVGRVTSVNPSFYLGLVDQRRVPVVASLAFSPDTGWLNVNADLMAAALAAGLGARRLWLMTEVAGVRAADGARIPRLTLSDAERLIASGAARDGMIPKLEACRVALRARVPEVVIVGPDAGGLKRAAGTAPPPGTRVVAGPYRAGGMRGAADARAGG